MLTLVLVPVLTKEWLPFRLYHNTHVSVYTIDDYITLGKLWLGHDANDSGTDFGVGKSVCCI